MKNPVYAELSVIGMKGCEEFAANVDYYLKEWRRHGGDETFLVDVDCPRFSAEYIMAGGNEQVILCERGIRTFDDYTRNTLDLAAVPMLRQLTHLPIIVDPSHATGRANLVLPMALASAACGADGLIIEVHNDPMHALCDGAQSLRPEEYAALARKVQAVREVTAL